MCSFHECVFMNRHDQVLHNWWCIFSMSAAQLSQQFLFCVTVCIIYYPCPLLLKWTTQFCQSLQGGCSTASFSTAVASDCAEIKKCFVSSTSKILCSIRPIKSLIELVKIFSIAPIQLDALCKWIQCESRVQKLLGHMLQALCAVSVKSLWGNKRCQRLMHVTLFVYTVLPHWKRNHGWHSKMCVQMYVN